MLFSDIFWKSQVPAILLLYFNKNMRCSNRALEEPSTVQKDHRAQEACNPALLDFQPFFLRPRLLCSQLLPQKTRFLGFESGRPKLPLVGKNITIVVGDPIEFDVPALRKEAEVAVRKAKAEGKAFPWEAAVGRSEDRDVAEPGREQRPHAVRVTQLLFGSKLVPLDLSHSHFGGQVTAGAGFIHTALCVAVERIQAISDLT